MPLAIYLELDLVEGAEAPTVRLIRSVPCPVHALVGACKQCDDCLSSANGGAVTPFPNVTPWPFEVTLDGASHCQGECQTEAVSSGLQEGVDPKRLDKAAPAISVGLTIKAGSPDSIPAVFEQNFGEKEKQI